MTVHAMPMLRSQGQHQAGAMRAAEVVIAEGGEVVAGARRQGAVAGAAGAAS